MIKDVRTGEVVKKYELKDCRYSMGNYSKLLGKWSRYNYKHMEDTNVLLRPYSESFLGSRPSHSFNNKKFSII